MNNHRLKAISDRFAIHREGIAAVFCGAFVHLTLGTVYTIGNLNPYFLSYLCRADPQCTFPTPNEPSPLYNQYQSSLAWVFACSGSAQASMMFIGGTLEKIIGPKYACYSILLKGCVQKRKHHRIYLFIYSAYVFNRYTLLLGSLIMSLSVFLTSFTVDSFVLLLLTQVCKQILYNEEECDS